MSKEILAIPEDKLREVIYVIRAGIKYSQAIPLDPLVKLETISYETIESLTLWCDQEEEYLNMLEDKNDLG